MSRPRAILSWSSGKDSAWTLHEVRRTGAFEVAGLFTTVNGEADRVAMHGVRRALLEAQGRAADLPLHVAELPWPCDNDSYLGRTADVLRSLKEEEGVTHVIFGDLFLEDIRAWREDQMAALDLAPVFPLFGRDTTKLARAMVDGGLEARLSCVDGKQLDPSFSGRAFDHALLDALPAGVDPCGENGEFHTLVTAGPMFDARLRVTRGEAHVAGQFHYTDFRPA